MTCKSRIITGVLAALVLFGCTPQPQLVKRYNAIVGRVERPPARGQLTSDNPEVRFMALPVDDAKPKTAFDLTDRGQAALLQGLGQLTKDPKSLLSAAGQDLGIPVSGSTPADVNLTTFKKRVVYTIERGSRRPVDRLQWAVIDLDIHTPGAGAESAPAHFVTWNNAETKYEKIDLGKLNQVQERSAKLTGTFKPPGEVAEPGFELSSKHTLTESQDQQRRIVDLNVYLVSKEKGRVVRQGAIDRDLSGNTIVEYTIKYSAEKNEAFLQLFSDLWHPNGTPKPVQEIVFHKYNAEYPQKATDIMATASMEYELRQTESGDDTLNEGDDNITIVTGSTNSGQKVLITTSDQKLKVQRLGLFDVREEQQTIVTYEPETDKAPCREPDTRVLQFRKYSEAQAFYDWLERSTKANVFTKNKIVVSRNNFVLCHYKVGDESTKRVLEPSEIKKLWIFEHALN